MLEWYNFRSRNSRDSWVQPDSGKRQEGLSPEPQRGFLPPQLGGGRMPWLWTTVAPFKNECRCLSVICGPLWGVFGTEGTLDEMCHNTGLGYAPKPTHLLSWATAQMAADANLWSKDMAHTLRCPKKLKESWADHRGCGRNIRRKKNARNIHRQDHHIKQ